MFFSETRKGEFSAYGATILGSLFPLLTVLTVTKLPPLYAASIATGFAALFFACTLSCRKGWGQMRNGRSSWKNILLATLFNGVIYHGLIFSGFQFTSPGNGAVVGLMEIFFAFVIVNLLLRHERFIPSHLTGAFLMLSGALIILLPSWDGGMHIGDLLILLATAAAPLGTIFAQRARKAVSADMFMLIRSVISAVFLFILACMFEIAPMSSVWIASWWFLLLNGIFMMGLAKLLWVEAIHRLPITKTVALAPLGVMLTLVFAYLFLGEHITVQQAMSVVPMAYGMWLLTRKDYFSNRSNGKFWGLK